MASKKKNGKDVRAEIQAEMTARIVEAVKAGTPPWRKPWSADPNSGWPQNIASKKGYRGMNPLLLECTCMDLGFASRWWGTYKQWANLGCQVKKRPDNVDYWGTKIVYWQFKEYKDKEDLDDDGNPKVKKFPFLRTYTVFNLEQVDDPDGKLDRFRVKPTEAQIKPEAFDDPVFDMAKAVIAGTGAEIGHGGNRAFYRPPSPSGSFPDHTSGDTIQLPEPVQFESPQDYFFTGFHEIGHWTEVRLEGRNEEYAFHELRAEIASCFLANACNVPMSDDLTNHNAYVSSWLERMGNDPAFIFKASSLASKACEYVLKISGHTEVEEEEEAELAA
jgi:antirestriction protein ArdC